MSWKRGRWKRIMVGARPSSVPLSHGERAAIYGALSNGGVGGNVDDFCRDFQQLVADYRVSVEMEQTTAEDGQQPTPGEVTAALTELKDAIDSLGQKLVTHDSATAHLFRRHLAESIGSDNEASAILSRVRADLRALIRAAASARREASELSGRRAERPRSARRVLAEELAASYIRHLDRRPTAVDDGAFSQCLRYALELGRPSSPETGRLSLLARHGIEALSLPHINVRRGVPPINSDSNHE